MSQIEKTRLIKEAHSLLDKIELNIYRIVNGIKAKKQSIGGNK
jgi:hypothetical protein